MPTPVVAGQVFRASQYNQGITAWTDFSSAALVVAFGGGMLKGSSTYVARYTQFGKIVFYTFIITINTGGGFATGTGIWSFLLPVAAQASIAGTGSCQLVDNGTAIYSAVATMVDNTHIRIYKNASLSALDATGPGTAWATGDSISVAITYEAA